MAKTSARTRYTPRKADLKPPVINTSAKSRKKSGFTIYIDDDDTPPPETGLGTPSKNAKPVASSSDYGGSSDNEELIAVAEQAVLMRSWVDCGIQMAIKEMEAEKLGEEIANSEALRAKIPMPQTYQHSAPYATPSQSQSSYAQYYNGAPCAVFSTPPYSQGYYTPQHGMAYAPQFQQTTCQCLPQSYYATPPTSRPPFLQMPAPFSPSAPPQSSPTLQPHNMTAFHNGSIPQSAGFAPNDRQPFTPASSNIQPPNSASKSQAAEQPFVLPPGHYLSWHELEHHYGPAPQIFHNDDAYKSARLDWIKTIKIDDPPFNHPWVAEDKRQEVEDIWAGLPATKRHHVEMFALAYRYRAMVQAPFRDVAAYALPLPFMALEAQYFNLPERKLASYADTMRKRSAWLTDLGLVEPIYHALCSTQEQETALETAYTKLSVVKRRAIEAKAKYLKVMLNPPKPTFREFEELYSIHKKQDFARQSEHKTKRGEWIRAIGLDDPPFSWYPYTTTELGIAQCERTEVAWNALGLARRRELETKAAEYKGAQIWAYHGVRSKTASDSHLVMARGGHNG
ncbi:hypothetical protein DL98DRAFT_650633 [Cadophora sp. DSE1049]|nr:hypothetical protein DL98DRAFT_650633 [Cadophora sp. DSE1049]